MRTSEAFNGTPDIVSELAYCAINTSEPETAELLIRAAREIRTQRNTLSQLKDQASLDSWDKYPDRMGGAYTKHEITEASTWREHEHLGYNRNDLCCYGT